MDIRAARTWRNRRTATLRALGDGLRVVLEDGLGEVRPCRTSQQQGRRNVLTPGGELGRAMPWYRSGVLCNSQTSRRPVGDDGDFHIIPRSWRVLVGYNCGNRRSRRWNPYLSAIPSVSVAARVHGPRRAPPLTSGQRWWAT